MPLKHRPFLPAEDALIKAHWLDTASNAIGQMMVPPREGTAIRVRARRLGLPRKQEKNSTGNTKHGRSAGEIARKHARKHARRLARTTRPYPAHIIEGARRFAEWRAMVAS